jgi:hypothetical protein
VFRSFAIDPEVSIFQFLNIASPAWKYSGEDIVTSPTIPNPAERARRMEAGEKPSGCNQPYDTKSG